MGNPRGFLEVERQKLKRLPVQQRLQNCDEFEQLAGEGELQQQASRCMDCGIPFCHQGCPLHNLIPEFNDHVYRGQSERAEYALLETNNFPEVTGRVCPAPCEAACVLNLENTPVAIKDIERSIAEQLLQRGLTPQPPARESGHRVAVVGSGPAGMAAAQQLRRMGHAVTLFEQAAKPGGLLRYGIPDFKLDKRVLDQRFAQLEAEGVELRCGARADAAQLAEFDGVVLAVGARTPRDLPVPGRELDGVHFAMEYLSQHNERIGGERTEGSGLLATGLDVVVLGGGDTGSDCVGTALRQGARSVTSLELMPQPPSVRGDGDLWPAWPQLFRTSSSHEEGGERRYAQRTLALLPDADGVRVAGLQVQRMERRGDQLVPVEGSEQVLPASLVLLAMGFVASEPSSLYEALGVPQDARGRLSTVDGFAGRDPKVVVCGDAYRGASLVVWAIADGRRAAAQLDRSLRR